jgi:hypothetical protein
MPPPREKYSPLRNTLKEQRLLAHPTFNKSTLCLNDNKMNYIYPIAFDKAESTTYCVFSAPTPR